jgi:hypothetical protein
MGPTTINQETEGMSLFLSFLLFLLNNIFAIIEEMKMGLMGNPTTID